MHVGGPCLRGLSGRPVLHRCSSETGLDRDRDRSARNMQRSWRMTVRDGKLKMENALAPRHIGAIFIGPAGSFLLCSPRVTHSGQWYSLQVMVQLQEATRKHTNSIERINHLRRRQAAKKTRFARGTRKHRGNQPCLIQVDPTEQTLIYLKPSRVETKSSSGMSSSCPVVHTTLHGPVRTSVKNWTAPDKW